MSLNDCFEGASLLANDDTVDPNMGQYSELSDLAKIQRLAVSCSNAYKALREVQRRIGEDPKPTYFFGIIEGRRPKSTPKRPEKKVYYRHAAMCLAKVVKDLNAVACLLSHEASKEVIKGVDGLEAMYEMICIEDPEYIEVEKTTSGYSIRQEFEIMKKAMEYREKDLN